MAINQLLLGLQLPLYPSVTYLANKGPKTCDKGQIPTFSITFPPTPLQCNWLELGKPTRGGETTREQINVKMRGALENPQTQFSASSRLFLDQK